MADDSLTVVVTENPTYVAIAEDNTTVTIADDALTVVDVAEQGPPGPPGEQGPPGSTEGGNAIELDGIPVTLTSPQPNDVLIYSGGAFVNAPADNLTDGGNF